jgi:hypothetical protein
MFDAQLAGSGFQAILIASDQQQIKAAGSQTLGVNRPDAR